MSAAQFEFEPQTQSESQPFEEGTGPASALKLQTAERLAAHRARRGRVSAPQLPGLETPSAQPGTRASRIAAAVAERYAQSQSYRAFLAAEAERAIQQAEAAAEVAQRTAQAVVATQQQLLSELEDWAPAEAPAPKLVAPVAQESAQPQPAQSQTAQTQSSAPVNLTVRLYEDVGRTAPTGIANAVPSARLSEEEQFALDDEIAFRKAPTFDEFLEPSTPLPANLIEFPRQLVAPRKARPRIAEGPLREESTVAPETAQLRIFEVEPDQISTQFIPQAESALPEWSSIRLSATPVAAPAPVPEHLVAFGPQLYVAPVSLRLMATLVDGCLVGAGFLGFITVFSYTAGRLPTGPTAALSAAGILLPLALAYYLLFFTLSDATPGMRYARIGLCTFSDDNPTRAAMRRRLIAILLAACPAGLGILWAWFDQDSLGWHDRISRMYQRSY